MEFHPVTTDYTLTNLDLLSLDEQLSGILDEFYSCPECGAVAQLHEEFRLPFQVSSFTWHAATVVELF